MSLSLMAAVPMQTVQDSMSGNWPVINGKKLFVSGMNLAWIGFGSDVGDKAMDINAFTGKIKQIRKAGGNSVRWWLHTDAQNCPKIDTSGAVTGLGANTIKNLRAALDTAYAYGVVVDMCLFSFDMLVPGSSPLKSTYSSFNLESNYKFLTDTAKITTYLEKGLKPILDSVGNHPAVMCWEVFNEPEGMLASANWSHVTKKITQNDILRITNRIAGFVHRNSKKMASTGVTTFGYLSSEYSDAKLKAAGGDADGYLDFYMAHYYPEWQEQSISPFHNPASKWAMDRPIIIGEFPAKGWSTSTIGKSSGTNLKTSMTIIGAYEYAYAQGYAGAMSWAMTESDTSLGTYETTAPALTALYSAHQNDVMIKDVTITELSGDLAMQVALDLPAEVYPEAEYNSTFDFSSVDSVLVDLYLAAGSATNLTVGFVFKSTSSWLWCPSSITYTLPSTGTWVTYSVPVSSFASSVAGSSMNLAEIKQVLLQFSSSTADAFKGTLYVDNVRYKKGTTETVISDFNKEGSAWSEYESGTNDNVSLSIVARPANTSVKGSRLTRTTMAGQVSLSQTGRKLVITQGAAANTQIRLLDVMGKTVLSTDMFGTSGTAHTIDCSALASGRYLVEIRQGVSSAISGIILQ